MLRKEHNMTRDISYFPIGTVVVLKNSTAATVISGYLAENVDMPGYTWDYSGFVYPIGLRDENEVYTFDHTQIEQVLAIGYQDGECFAFQNTFYFFSSSSISSSLALSSRIIFSFSRNSCGIRRMREPWRIRRPPHSGR